MPDTDPNPLLDSLRGMYEAWHRDERCDGLEDLADFRDEAMRLFGELDQHMTDAGRLPAEWLARRSIADTGPGSDGDFRSPARALDAWSTAETAPARTLPTGEVDWHQRAQQWAAVASFVPALVERIEREQLKHPSPAEAWDAAAAAVAAAPTTDLVTSYTAGELTDRITALLRPQPRSYIDLAETLRTEGLIRRGPDAGLLSMLLSQLQEDNRIIRLDPAGPWHLVPQPWETDERYPTRDGFTYGNRLRTHLRNAHANLAATGLHVAAAEAQHRHEHHGPGTIRLHPQPWLGWTDYQEQAAEAEEERAAAEGFITIDGH